MDGIGLGRGYVAAELGLTDIAAAQQHAMAPAPRPRKRKVKISTTKKAKAAIGGDTAAANTNAITWNGFVEQAVQRVQQRLIASGATMNFFEAVRPLLVAGRYDEVVEERSALLFCGKIGCAERLPDFDMDEKTYRVSVEDRCIYDTTALKMFCSRECHRASHTMRTALAKVTPESELAWGTTCATLKKLFPRLTDADLIDLNPRVAAVLGDAPSQQRLQPSSRPRGEKEKNLLPKGVVIKNTEITPQPKTAVVEAEPRGTRAFNPMQFTTGLAAPSSGTAAAKKRASPAGAGESGAALRPPSPKVLPSAAPAAVVGTAAAAASPQHHRDPQAEVDVDAAPAPTAAPARKRPTRGRREVITQNQAAAGDGGVVAAAAPVGGGATTADLFAEAERARKMVGMRGPTFNTRPTHMGEDAADMEGEEDEENEEEEEDEPQDGIEEQQAPGAAGDESAWSDSDDSLDVREEICFDTLPTYCQAYEVLQDWVTPETRRQLKTREIVIVTTPAAAEVAGPCGAPNAGEIEGDDHALGVNTGVENDAALRASLAVEQLEHATSDVCVLLSPARLPETHFVKWLNRVFQTLQPQHAVPVMSRTACVAVGLLFAHCYDSDACGPVLAECSAVIGMKRMQIDDLLLLLG